MHPPPPTSGADALARPLLPDLGRQAVTPDRDQHLILRRQAPPGLPRTLGFLGSERP